MRVLVVEDDQRLARLMARVLGEERYLVDLAHDGALGLEMALQGVYEVAILDWMLPGRDGPEICRAVRRARLTTALLLLTARGQLEDRVGGLDSGADDYLVKPFAFEELLARVRALSRRFSPTGDPGDLRAGDLVLDLRSHTARRGPREIELTPTERNLLEYLLRHAGQTLTRQQILEYVWLHERDVQESLVEVYISYLRRKLNAAGERDPIVTVRGVGYRLEAPMLSGLRIQLTLLYGAAALALMILVGGGVYLVVARYFDGATDLALQHKMAHQLQLIGAPVPPALADADRDWSNLRASGRADDPEEGDEHDEDSDEAEDSPESDEDRRPAAAGDDAELAAIFVLPLDSGGRLLSNPNPYDLPIDPDVDALAAALANGSDLRTVAAASGEPVRLLTYRVPGDDGPAALQLGRELGDQRRVLDQLLGGMLALGAASAALLGLGSWWLAGRALRPAQLAWERQQSFIASASHELRTPLTLIRASGEVALRLAPAGDLEQRELLGDILGECDHMRRLVDDLLLLSRLDSGRLSLSLSSVDLGALLAELRRSVGRLAEQRGAQLSLGAAEGCVRADPERLRQILLIVLDNALRYTPAGGAISLSVDAPQRGALRISVRDSGPGIPPEHLPHIFERFYRADPARGAGAGNLGLGLPIARSLAEAMHGSIRIESGPGGTTAQITLPAAPRTGV